VSAIARLGSSKLKQNSNSMPKLTTSVGKPTLADYSHNKRNTAFEWITRDEHTHHTPMELVALRKCEKGNSMSKGDKSRGNKEAKKPKKEKPKVLATANSNAGKTLNINVAKKSK